MNRIYSPRGMPERFMNGAPKIVKKEIIDIIKTDGNLEYDVIFRHVEPPLKGSFHSEMSGLDFDSYGSRGCHFFLSVSDMKAYRERKRKDRVYWNDLPEATQKGIVSYLNEDNS